MAEQAQGNEANPACKKSVIDLATLDKQLADARTKQAQSAMVTRKLRDNFAKLKSTYESEVSDLRRKLEAENRKRDTAADEYERVE